jgi:predicted adenine nucleotide alpha hydrolase (AANH) superfamily ATPase
MNYSNLLENKIAEIKAKGEKPRLLLHACCAPCSSYVLEYLNEHFDITLYFYNPNISPEKEYIFRQAELIRLVGEMGLPITVVSEKYSPEEFFEVSKGLEKEPEGGERCFKCYRLRLLKTAEYAKKNGFQFFTTTLSISPYKNAEKLNEIGGELSEKVGVNYLYSDFKKKNGYKRSIELSKEYNLYRQDYCGCIFSKEAK